MDLATLCRRPVVAIDREAPLREAARLMREHHVGALVVTRDGPGGAQIAGIVTDRDLAIELLARDADAGSVPVGRIAAEKVLTAPADAGIEEGIARMQAAGVRRLLVHGADGRLAGLVSFDDLFEACASMLSGLAAVLHKGIEREAARRAEAVAPPALHIPALGTAGWNLGSA